MFALVGCISGFWRITDPLRLRVVVLKSDDAVRSMEKSDGAEEAEFKFKFRKFLSHLKRGEMPLVVEERVKENLKL